MPTALSELAPQPNATVGSAFPYPALRRCLSFDLEVSIEDGRLMAAAAYRPDTGESLSMSENPSDGIFQRLERIAEGSPFIVRAIPQGHMVGGISLIWAIPSKMSLTMIGGG